MIILKELRWSNAFSYGKDNSINFYQAQLTQLVGKNGHGKSSIALILEEVLFNKNSKNIKKADILNRYVKDKSYTIELDFSCNSTEYTIKTTRGTTQTVRLYKNQQDISAHTSTGTYKLIEEIIGLDHKAFSQIVYQSSASSLEFLVAPDTARKKFLIEILNLSKYTRAQELFKQVASDLSKEISAVQGKITTINTWLNKYLTTKLDKKELYEIPELDPTWVSRSYALAAEIEGLDSTNKKITKNNTYKNLQAQIQLLPVTNKPDPISETNLQKVKSLNTRAVELKAKDKDVVNFISKLNKLQDKCPTCYQTIDNNIINNIICEQKAVQTNALEELQSIKIEIDAHEAEQKAYNLAYKKWEESSTAQSNWEKYHQLIDLELPSNLLDKAGLVKELATLEEGIAHAKKSIERLEKYNTEVVAHNTKVELLKAQLVEMKQELEVHEATNTNLNSRMNILNVLTKTFSTTGLVAYKIECLVKDLEDLTNKYLVDLSDGRFQISFRINSSDKLNVIITDNGKDIEIQALSNGEKSRVNVATLLAIRKLMQTLSSSRINLLILDETVETLDVEGKEKLVEVLLKEDFLNTFLVSHGFTHPLLEKVNVVKHNNISNIEV